MSPPEAIHIPPTMNIHDRRVGLRNLDHSSLRKSGSLRRELAHPGRVRPSKNLGPQEKIAPLTPEAAGPRQTQ